MSANIYTRDGEFEFDKSLYYNGKRIFRKMSSSTSEIELCKLIAQNEINRGVSHWASVWNRLDCINGLFIMNPIYFRGFYPNNYAQDNYLTVLNNPANINDPANIVSITQSKKRILDLFLYVLIDYRIQFITQNPFNAAQVPIKILTLRDIANNLRARILTGVI